ncbi:MAG: hypothetical protein ABWY63_14220 [Hyphomicrobiaceae bacterium]
MIELISTVALVALTAADGTTVMVNPREIVVIRGQGKSRLLTPGAHCVIGTTDGKFITVIQTCDDVKQAIEDTRP